MNQQLFDHKDFVASLPLLPGVYRMLDATGKVLYVGKANQLKKRVSSYFQKTNLSPRIRLMVSHIAKIEVTVTRSEAEALLLENNLIKALSPRYNILFRDDKSYPYIIFTGHDFPRIAYYRGATKKHNQYFGPYPNAAAAKETLSLLQKIFRLRSCEDHVFNNRTRPCLLHQIQRCSAPCVQLISKDAYAVDIKNAALMLQGKQSEVEIALRRAMEDASESMQYEQAAALRDQLQALRAVQQKQFVESEKELDVDIVGIAESGGEVCVALGMVRGGRHLGDKHIFPENAEGESLEEVVRAFLAQQYLSRNIPPLILTPFDISEELELFLTEQAGHKVKIRHSVSGEKKQWIEMAVKNALLALQQRAGQKAGQAHRLEALRNILSMPSINRIECFDISHTMGEATVASCVVYDNLSMRNSEYRKFNIVGIVGGDDYAAMRQALSRRYQKLNAGEGKKPDLVLIDGGGGQLNAAVAVMAELGLAGIPLVGVAKGVERKVGMEQLIRPGIEKPLQLSPDSAALHLIQQVRDEAHRFAIAGHRAKRGKVRVASVLEDIAGVGEKRRRNLLARFGGIKGVRQASIEELAQVDGVSRSLAEKIYQQFH